jgi:hypothetical protein
LRPLSGATLDFPDWADPADWVALLAGIAV